MNKEELKQHKKIVKEDNIRKQIRKRDKYECYFCGNNIENHLPFSIHETIPRVLGGKISLKNSITICHRCHKKLERLNRTLIKYMLKKRLIRHDGNYDTWTIKEYLNIPKGFRY